MNERLVRLAARRAPTDLAARLEEEWLSDLGQRRSAVSGLLFASGCLWATQVISLERARAFSFATAPAGDGVAALMGDAGFGRASRRSLSMLLVMGGHAAVFAALLLTVTGKLHVPKPEGPIVASNVKVVKPVVTTDVHPEIPAVRNIHVDQPEFPPVEKETKDGPKQVEQGQVELPPGPQPGNPPTIPEIVRRVGGIGAGFPNPIDYYPSEAIHLGKEGASVVQVCVGRAGQLTSAPKIVQSAGFGPLDDSALRLAKVGSGHYRPGTENGAPVESCYPVTIRFHLTNR
jgi:TonB family protein